jgi:hypothetical protein
MNDTNKIVAAILAAAATARNPAHLNTPDYVQAYENMLEEIAKRENRDSGFGNRLEAAMERHKKASEAPLP